MSAITGSQCDYAAGFLGYRNAEFRIPMFGGSMPITKLSLVPLRAMPDAEKVRRECIEQGKLWWQVIGGLHCAYNGVARVPKITVTSRYERNFALEETFVSLSALSNSTWSFANALKVEGKVMIDLEAFSEANPVFRPRIAVDTRVRKPLAPPPDDVLHGSRACTDSNLTDEQALVCPATASGFAFQSKVWAKFTVKALEPISWQVGMWKNVNMDEDRKQHIWTLTSNHDWAQNVRADRKDLGLKYLLHGRSGSGKSLTVGKCFRYNAMNMNNVLQREPGR
jgi:hypothetical protein